MLRARFPLDDSAALVNVARRHGVRVAPGSIHTVGDARTVVRIDVDRPLGLVREGIDRLARAWRDVASGSATTIHP